MFFSKNSWNIFLIVTLVHFCSVHITVSSSVNCKSNISITSENEYTLKNKENGPLRSKRSTKIFDQILSTTLFNTTMNFIVPGAKVHLPRHTDEGSVDHLAMQAFFGIFWAVAWLATIAIPFSKTYFQPLGLKRSLDDTYQEQNFKWKLNEKVAEAIGLNWRSCLQKSVCQAHEFPEKYGILGTAVQFMFPVDKPHGKEPQIHNNIHYDILDEAAFNGAIGQECDHIYKCFFDVLDVILYLKDQCFTSLSD